MGVDADPFPQIATTNITIPDMMKLFRPRVKVDLSKIDNQKPQQREGNQAMGEPTGKKVWQKTTIHDLRATFEQQKEVKTDEHKSMSRGTK